MTYAVNILWSQLLIQISRRKSLGRGKPGREGGLGQGVGAGIETEKSGESCLLL